MKRLLPFMVLVVALALGAGIDYAVQARAGGEGFGPGQYFAGLKTRILNGSEGEVPVDAVAEVTPEPEPAPVALPKPGPKPKRFEASCGILAAGNKMCSIGSRD